MPANVHCPICSGTAIVPRITKNNFTITRCTTCNTQQVTPIPSSEFLQAHYQNPAYFGGDEEQGYASYADMHKVLHTHFIRRLNTLARHMPQRGRLLDFGCADGYFLEISTRSRLDGRAVSNYHKAWPIRPKADLGLHIPATLSELTETNFDVITLWEVIEHLPDPVEQLRALHERLRQGGVLMLSTPNTGHWLAQNSPAEWDNYRPPSHLFFFTEETLRATLRTPVVSA